MRTNNFSNQFPIRRAERPQVGTLWYNGGKVNGAIELRFCELNGIKSGMICHGYKKDGFKVTY